MTDFFCKRCHTKIDIGSLKCPECNTRTISGVNHFTQKIGFSFGFVFFGIIFMQLTMNIVGYIFFAIGILSWVLNIKWIKQTAARVFIKTDIIDNNGRKTVVALSVQGWNEKNIEKLEKEIVVLSGNKIVLSANKNKIPKLNPEYFYKYIRKIKNAILRIIQAYISQNESTTDNQSNNDIKKMSTTDKYCNSCKIYVKPTFHGLCPICDCDLGKND